MQKIIEDKELGTIVLRKYPQSRAYTIRLKQGKVSVSLPQYGTYQKAMDLLEIHRQNLLEKIQEVPQQIMSVAEESLLRRQAHAYLPGRLKQLADTNGFVYTSLKINKSRGRWGSCSSRKSINLSLYLMKLPAHLIDYVLLHELCHTKIMNHSPQFWHLLDQVTDGKAKLLRRELKAKAAGK